MRKIFFTVSLSLALAGSALAGDIPIPRSAGTFPTPGCDGKTPVATTTGDDKGLDNTCKNTPIEVAEAYMREVSIIKIVFDIIF